MTIFCDLDGTLLDITEKFHRIYSHLLHEHGYEPLQKADYWKLRRSGLTTFEILSRTGAGTLLSKYEAGFLERVEDRSWMAFDAPFDGVPPALRGLRSVGRVVLVTLRRNRGALTWQLSHTGLAEHLDLVLSGHDTQREGWKIKADLVREALPGCDFSSSWFVGDMATDIRAGKALGCRTAAVQTGMCDESSLRLLAPDFVLHGIKDLATKVGL